MRIVLSETFFCALHFLVLHLFSGTGHVFLDIADFHFKTASNKLPHVTQTKNKICRGAPCVLVIRKKRFPSLRPSRLLYYYNRKKARCVHDVTWRDFMLKLHIVLLVNKVCTVICHGEFARMNCS